MSGEPSVVGGVTPEMDRHNGWIFTLCYTLVYLSAPVVYVDVVQAALCDKLGASATVANLPASAYLVGQIAPLIVSWLVSVRWERTVVVASYAMTSAWISLVLLTLLIPFPSSVRLGAVIGQGLLQGLSSSTALVFVYQCLNRGTTEKGRALALKRTFTFGPIAAVVGSLGAQYVLNSGIAGLRYPYDFAVIYLVGAPSMAAAAFLASRYRLPTLSEQGGQAVSPVRGFRDYLGSRPLLLLWCAYLFWYCALAATSNLTLYARAALGRDPKDFAGLMMAIRFGCKSVGGYLLGMVAIRWGLRASAHLTLALVGAASLWAWLVPGHAYLFAFGLMGAGELGGVYIPNYALALSPVDSGARNLALLTLATPASSFAPAVYGGLTDHFGFPASFAFGLVAALIGFAAVRRIRKPKPGT